MSRTEFVLNGVNVCEKILWRLLATNDDRNEDSADMTIELNEDKDETTSCFLFSVLQSHLVPFNSPVCKGEITQRFASDVVVVVVVVSFRLIRFSQ
jgi:hypothetical protein